MMGWLAHPERIRDARRQWPEANADDFERLDGKRAWRDKATGVVFRQASGCPLLAVGTDSVRDVVCSSFTLAGSSSWSATYPRRRSFITGPVLAREIPNPGGPPTVQIH